MTIRKVYKNRRQAEAAMKRRGLFAWQPHYWRMTVTSRGESLAPPRHTKLDTALVNDWTLAPSVIVEYIYFT